MEKKLFTVKDKMFLSLFFIGWFAICFGTYKILDIKLGEETVSFAKKSIFYFKG